jgi:hypothetical protein
MKHDATKFEELLCSDNKSIKIENQEDTQKKYFRRATKTMVSVFSKSLNMRLKRLKVEKNQLTLSVT